MIDRCGGCYFGKLISEDITKRLCHGAPPTSIQVPAPGGQMSFRMARPIVDVSDEACALYRPKAAVMQQLTDMNDGATKQ
jgi:hypothetical protein